MLALACVLWLAGASLATAIAAGMPDSASKVRIKAGFAGPANSGHPHTVRVHLDTADGWHVNAHPASLNFLIATTIQARAGGKRIPVTVDYPAGHDAGIKLGGKAIKVYGGDTVIPVRLSSDAASAARAAGQLQLSARVQACSNKGVCLPPSRISTQLDWP
jgi:hypothetical protein